MNQSLVGGQASWAPTKLGRHRRPSVKVSQERPWLKRFRRLWVSPLRDRYGICLARLQNSENSIEQVLQQFAERDWWAGKRRNASVFRVAKHQVGVGV